MWTTIFCGKGGYRRASVGNADPSQRAPMKQPATAEETPTPPRQVLRRPNFLRYPTWEEVLAARRPAASPSPKSFSESSDSSGNAMFEMHGELGLVFNDPTNKHQKTYGASNMKA